MAGITVYSYDANGNLLNQSGAGKASIYTYDVYNRLIQYVEGSKKESYSYDAEGVRRSKVNGEEAIYYVSDTTGSLSYTLAEIGLRRKSVTTKCVIAYACKQVNSNNTLSITDNGYR